MKPRGAFTLVELLCVLVIVAILLGLLSNSLANGLTWAQSGYEEEVIGDQLEQALDVMAYDVRNAVDIDVDYFERADSRPLSEIRTSFELRLLAVDEGDERAMGRIVYSLRQSDGIYNKENPLERPRPSCILYRAQEDSLHRGNNQPVAMYLSTLSQTPKGMQIYYYNRAAERCSLAEEVTTVEIRLAGRTKDGTSVTRSRLVPLTAKFE